MSQIVDWSLSHATAGWNRASELFATQILAFWHWITVNSLFIVIAINFGALFCAICLALHARVISRRVRQLALASERDSLLIDKLMRELDALAQKSASLPAPQSPMGGHIADHSLALQVREEIEWLRDEISSTRDEASHYTASEISASSPAAEYNSLSQIARQEIENVKAELAAADDSESVPANGS